MQGQWKKASGLFWYFQTLDLKYSPVGAWLVHIWVRVDMRYMWVGEVNKGEGTLVVRV